MFIINDLKTALKSSKKFYKVSKNNKKQFGKQVIAFAVCVGILLAWSAISVLMEWKHGGGLIAMVIPFFAIIYTWKKITK